MEDKQREDQSNQVNQSRSPFTKHDNKRKNLHSEDIDREEISEGDPNRETLEKRRLEENIPGKTQQRQ
jgi:hypothetical protein